MKASILNDKNREMEFRRTTLFVSILIDNVIFKQMTKLPRKIKWFIL
jgi:hypothetical protein